MFRIWRRGGGGSSGGRRREDEGEQGEERGMMEGVDEESGEIDASLFSPVKGDPFSASEDEIRAIEEWWSQKEAEEAEEEWSEEEVMSEEEKEEDSITDELISRLKEIGTEEEEESPLMHEMEELGNLSVEDLLLLAKEIREGVEKIKEERKERLEAVEKSASARAREEAEGGAKAKKARDEKSSHRVFS
ncbi:MAG: hypothetical protein OD814_001747 [Candidatus Alkanophagales archaeon MCA70_species_1]|nr:hypothetical protein [Candidatus Alkanophaga volatiphilum]